MEATTALTNTVFIIFCILVVGLFMELFQSLLTKIFTRAFGSKFAYTFLNRITFIGVMHHELSHALFTLLTGARIEKMNLFKPDEQAGTLGNVVYSTRGLLPIRCIQYTLISIAPVICGSITCTLMVLFVKLDAIWKVLVFGFILLCIVIHMNISKQDLKVALKGFPFCLLLIYLGFYMSNFDLLKYLSEYFVNKG